MYILPAERNRNAVRNVPYVFNISPVAVGA